MNVLIEQAQREGRPDALARAVLDPDGAAVEGVAPVSVIVPCFRCTATIDSAVASVAAQLLKPAEVLLVDDASGDGTREKLHKVARAYPPGWVRVFALSRNTGPSGARNLGWAHATQPYIAFLDADDTWHPQKLKIQMEVLAADPQIALLAHRMNVQLRSAPPPAQRYPMKVRVLPGHLLQLRSPFPTASIVIRRDLPFRFDESRRRSEDFLLWAQILLSGYRCAKINQVLASWHKPPFGAGGLSGDLAAMYKAGIDARRVLHAQGLLGRGQLYLVNTIGVVRYVRRCVITYGRRLAIAWRLWRDARSGRA
ncbi:glycosyltransferase family 2 protein [Frateuria defendens]|uniref:glycosyltransferase family 2 protein n=1 Tax=Frateuria defendens TaxID=2219559 RepID=UPI00066FC15B|nr:glycosyltransferase family 2 protein [Frateuria defendens]